MNRSDLENDYLLNEQRVIWLAEDIEEAILQRIATQIAYLRAKDKGAPIHIYFRSQGGDSATGLALGNVISGDCNIHGWLLGDTASSAATAWACCKKRFVFANSQLGIHPVTRFEQDVKYDAAKAQKWAQSLMATDERQCEIYAAASNCSFVWWWERYNQPGDVKWLSASELVKIGMAEKAAEWGK